MPLQPLKPGMFDPEQLHEIVEKHLPKDLKPGEKVLIGMVTTEGASVAVQFGVNEHVTAEGFIDRSWAGNTTAAGKVIVRF